MVDKLELTRKEVVNKNQFTSNQNHLDIHKEEHRLNLAKMQQIRVQRDSRKSEDISTIYEFTPPVS